MSEELRVRKSKRPSEVNHQRLTDYDYQVVSHCVYSRYVQAITTGCVITISDQGSDGTIVCH